MTFLGYKKKQTNKTDKQSIYYKCVSSQNSDIYNIALFLYRNPVSDIGLMVYAIRK